MRRTILAIGCLVAGCAPLPRPAPTLVMAPAPRVIVVHVPVPVEAPTTTPVNAAAPAAVIRESRVAVDEAARYVAWPQSKLATNNTLVVLTSNVHQAVAAMLASRRHGHYSRTAVAHAQNQVALLSLFLAQKGD